MDEQNVVDAEVVDPNAEQNVEVNDDITEITPSEIIDAFQAVFEELIILRNSVINLHERVEKLETPKNVSV